MARVIEPKVDLVYDVRVVEPPVGSRRLVVSRHGKVVYLQALPDGADVEAARLALFARWRDKARSQGGDAHIRIKGTWVVTLPRGGEREG
ncbi:MAG: hypothetical protein EP330_13745 [Deltaproteobacteria bacterium]|nr:MAG: hypothetical protein EP330_13745 [Deltaproteobacteria bacterium]